MLSKIKKAKASTLWIITLVLFMVFILMIHLVNSTNNPRALLILAVIMIFVVAILLQMAMYKTFRYRPKKKPTIIKKYILSDFDLIEKNLKKEEFTIRRPKYGLIYAKIHTKTIFKITVIKDSSLYFTNEQDDNLEPTKGIEKCTKMVSIDIFYENNDIVIKKSPEFLLQASNLYSEAFYFDEKKQLIIRPNVEEIIEDHQKDYEKIMKILGFVNVKEEENEL